MVAEQEAGARVPQASAGGGHRVGVVASPAAMEPPDDAALNAPGRAISHGERTRAVTLPWMRAEIDAGPIAFCAEFPSGDDEGGLFLRVGCVREGRPLGGRLLGAALGPATIPTRASPRRLGRPAPATRPAGAVLSGDEDGTLVAAGDELVLVRWVLVGELRLSAASVLEPGTRSRAGTSRTVRLTLLLCGLWPLAPRY